MTTNSNVDVNNEIIKLIIHSLDNNQKLPTESEMMKQFNVNRFTLREMLAPYEINGIIVSQQGSGRYAHEPDLGLQLMNTWTPFILHRPQYMLDFFEIRKCLELSSLSIAIHRLRPNDLIALRRITGEMMDKAQRGESFEDNDREFHCTLYECTGNPLFNQLLTAFWELCERTIVWPKDQPGLIYTAHQHIDILEALACKDEKTATRLLSLQFDESRNHLALALVKNVALDQAEA